MASTPEAAGGKSVISSSLAASLASALKIPLALLCLVSIAIATYYFVYVTDKRTYLVDRNFRLLATIGREIESSIETDHRILVSLGQHGLQHGQNGTRKTEMVGSECKPLVANHRFTECASAFIPILRSATAIAWPDIIKGDVRIQFVEPESPMVWGRRDDTESHDAVVQLEVDELIAPIVRSALVSSVFDTVLVATTDGRVIDRAGNLDQRITRLDKLTSVTDPKNPVKLEFDALSRSASMVNVEISGSTYTLFTQPCCGRVAHDAREAPASDGWVLCGLSAQRRLSAESYAVPFSILMLASGILLAALLGWPFLRLTLIGESDRVKAHDVVLVGLCGLLALGLVTVFALDVFASIRLEALLDGELERFARAIESSANQEIEAASRQLDELEKVMTWQLSDLGDSFSDQADRRWSYFTDSELRYYPWFESFAMIDADGLQRKKLSLGSFVTSLIDVSDREYFTHWRSTSRPDQRFLDSIRSATTGAREAVLAKASSEEELPVATLSIPMRSLIDPIIPPGFGFVVVDADGKVLFHSNPQHNLSEDFFVESDRSRRLRALTAARDMEHVDISYWGEDHRAFVKPFRPGAQLFDRQWTIVTFYDKDLLRTVRTEWLVHAILFLLIYVGVYVGISMVALILRPSYRAPWLWPDPARSAAYLDLLPQLLLLLLVFGVAMYALPPGDLLMASVLLPFLGWLAAHVRLMSHPSGRRLAWAGAGAIAIGAPLAVAARAQPGGLGLLLVVLIVLCATLPFVMRGHRRHPLAPPVNVSYGLAAGLLLLVATVFPAAAFFKVAWGLQIGSLVKYGQLQVTLDRIDRYDHDEAVLAKQVSRGGSRRIQSIRRLQEGQSRQVWGIYDRFFFEIDTGNVERRTPEEVSRGLTPVIPAAAPPVTKPERNALPEMIEEILPFYSESSVRLRELVHDTTADGSWEWKHRDTVLLLHVPGGTPQPVSSSRMPLLFERLGLAALPRLVALALGVIAVAGLLVWVIRFVLYKIFVVDVMEPLWSGRSDFETDASTPNLFVVSNSTPTDGAQLERYCVVDFVQAPVGAADWPRWFEEQLGRIRQAPPAHGVLAIHFDHRVSDREFSEQKLRLLESILGGLTRTVVAISAAPPSVCIESSAGRSAADAAADVEWTRRWSEVLSTFTVVPAAPSTAASSAQHDRGHLTDLATTGWREAVWRLNALGFAHSAAFLDSERRDPQLERHWRDVLPYAWLPDRPPLSVSQLLVEVGERAENHYQQIWASCTPAEQLVLGQLAQEGLVNHKTRRTVRALMARGLITRQPNFALTSETFRRFVLASYDRSDASALEGQVASAWTAIRWPFFALVVLSLAFFFKTQQQLFNTALAIITGVTAFVPAVFKMISLFSDRQTSA